VPLSSIHIQKDVSLAPFTTLQIGGPARFFLSVASEAELLEAVTFARQRSIPIFILGGGSNLLVGDSGFPGLVLHIVLKEPTITAKLDSRLQITVAAGVEWNDFVLSICQQGISGIECLAGIPGSVGGTPVQNVGAYGQEVAETIASVRALDLKAMQFVELSNSQCGFAYRKSIFNSTHRGRYIVTAVTFWFDPTRTPHLTYADLTRHFGNTQPTPIDVYHVVREIRHAKGMLLVAGEPDGRSAGSFFKNPVVQPQTLKHIASALQIDANTIPHWSAAEGNIKLPAAWLVERAGFPRGFTMGNAGISSRHTLALINRGNAKAADILALRDTIQSKVNDLFSIQLEQEPVQIGS